MTPADWGAVSEIFQQGINTGNATFETTVPSWEKWDLSHIGPCRLIAESGGRIAGWAAISPVSGRSVYAGVAEVSIYISELYRGIGIGSCLLARLVGDSEKEGIWTLQAGIFPENAASLRLHKKNGFREVGFRERIGRMNGIWRNTVLLERRSPGI